MKLMRVIRKVKKGDNVINYRTWKRKKKTEARQLSCPVAHIEIEDLHSDDYLRLRVYLGGYDYKKNEITGIGNVVDKMIEFLDTMAAECKQKFPNVKVDW